MKRVSVKNSLRNVVKDFRKDKCFMARYPGDLLYFLALRSSFNSVIIFESRLLDVFVRQILLYSLHLVSHQGRSAYPL